MYVQSRQEVREPSEHRIWKWLLVHFPASPPQRPPSSHLTLSSTALSSTASSPNEKTPAPQSPWARRPQNSVNPPNPPDDPPAQNKHPQEPHRPHIDRPHQHQTLYKDLTKLPPAPKPVQLTLQNFFRILLLFFSHMAVPIYSSIAKRTLSFKPSSLCMNFPSCSRRVVSRSLSFSRSLFAFPRASS